MTTILVGVLALAGLSPRALAQEEHRRGASSGDRVRVSCEGEDLIGIVEAVSDVALSSGSSNVLGP